MSAHVIPVLRTESEAIAAAQAYADTLAPNAADRDRSGVFPHQALADLAQTGLLGIRVPAEYGGADLPHSAVAEVFRIISAADSAVAQIPQSHFAFVDALRVAGSPGQREFFFAEVLRGRRIGNAASERGGKTAADFRTRLRDTPHGPLVSGTKYYATGAAGAEWIAVYALDEREQLALVYVAGAAEGLEISEDWTGMGQKATGSGTVVLDGVRVRPDHIISPWEEPSKRRWWYLAGRLAHSAIDIGIAEGALTDGLGYLVSRARTPHGLPYDSPGEDPLLQHSVGALASKIAAGRALLGVAAVAVDTAQLSDRDEDVRRAAVLVDQVKAFSSDIAVEAGSELFTWTGTSGVDERFDLHRHWRNARTHTLHDPVRWKYADIGARVIDTARAQNVRAQKG